MITMTELARLAGVSQSTVSRVLNGNPSVNPEAARRVRECARQYHYQPNMIARSLNGSKTCLLAVIVPDIVNPFFADVIKHIESVAAESGYNILIFNSDYSRKKEQKYLQLLQQYCVDGLLLAPLSIDEESIRPFCELTIPWMVITNDAGQADSVYISHEKAGCMVAEHMLDIGAEKYIFVGPRSDTKFLGYERGLRRAGIDTRKNLTVFWEQDKEKMLELLTRYLEELPEKAGIFAHNDMEALIVMNALLAAGIAIPDRAALAGFDDTFISRRVMPGITSVRQPVGKMCRYAVERILRQIQREMDAGTEHVELTAELVVRASTGLRKHRVP